MKETSCGNAPSTAIEPLSVCMCVCVCVCVSDRSMFRSFGEATNSRRPPMACRRNHAVGPLCCCARHLGPSPWRRHGALTRHRDFNWLPRPNIHDETLSIKRNDPCAPPPPVRTETNEKAIRGLEIVSRTHLLERMQLSLIAFDFSSKGCYRLLERTI